MSQKEIPETGRLNIGGLNEGVVIDHIQAGGAMKIYDRYRNYPLQKSALYHFDRAGVTTLFQIDRPQQTDLSLHLL